MEKIRVLEFEKEEVKEELKQWLKSSTLIPVIGSGFTRNCKTPDGVVPSGTDMKEYMLRELKRVYPNDSSTINSWTFSRIAKEYEKKVDLKSRKAYLQKNFLNVKLNDINKVNFLNFDWPYVYTLNIDDGIETNSVGYNVILPMKKINLEFIKKNKCLLKIHGDIKEVLCYENEKSIVFSEKSYAKSITENQDLLNMIKNDLNYRQLMFVGCSLDDEVDLLSIQDWNVDIEGKNTYTYYVANKKLTDLEMSQLEDFGINSIIVVKSFDSFYRNFVDLQSEVSKITVNEFEMFCNYRFMIEDSKLNSNLQYLFNTNHCFRDINQQIIYLPHFFIERTIQSKVIAEIDLMIPVCIIGNRVSGKTFFLLSIIKKYNKKKTYFFNSSTQLNDQAVNALLNESDSLLVFDTNAINEQQMQRICSRLDICKEKKISIVFALNSYDKELIRIINPKNNIKMIELKNIFNQSETKLFNSKTDTLHIHPYSEIHTILDYILDLSEKDLYNRYSQRNVNIDLTKKHIACFIMLLIKESLSTFEVYHFGYKPIIDHLHKIDLPVVDFDVRSIVEKDRLSNMKLLSNAKIWIHRLFQKYSNDKNYYQIVSDAFYHIISVLLSEEVKGRSYEKYIRFDTINELFRGQSGGAGGLINMIYEKLEDLLYHDPQFYHQRAKSILWMSKNDKDKLEMAVHFMDIAIRKVEQSLESKFNEKLDMSLSNLYFSDALIYGRFTVVMGIPDDKLEKALLKYQRSLRREPENIDRYLERENDNNKETDLKVLIKEAVLRDDFLVSLATDIKESLEWMTNMLIIS